MKTWPIILALAMAAICGGCRTHRADDNPIPMPDNPWPWQAPGQEQEQQTGGNGQ